MAVSAHQPEGLELFLQGNIAHWPVGKPGSLLDAPDVG